MNTRKLRKAILTLCSALLLVSLSVGLTVAYLTDTEAVVNTFTVGNVGICLDERDTDAEGDETYQKDPITDCTEHEHNGRDKANTYHLLPGHSYPKDPTVWIAKDSEEAYLRVKIAINNADTLDALFKKHNIDASNVAEMIFTGLDLNLWNVTSSVEDNVRTYVFDYKQTIKGGDHEIEIFSEIKVPDNFDNADVEALGEETTISISAEAIQVAGFEEKDGKTAKEVAWAAFDAQKAAANE